jgi:hypothetical protein
MFIKPILSNFSRSKVEKKTIEKKVMGTVFVNKNFKVLIVCAVFLDVFKHRKREYF